MTLDFFNAQMQRLASTWKPAYSPERVSVLWEEVKALPDHSFRRMVDKFLGEARQAPLLPEFREEISRERERSKVVSIWDGEPKSNCDYCLGIGVFICKHTVQPGFWAFRCHCVTGQQDPRTGIPLFKSEHAKEFVHYEARKDFLPRIGDPK